MPPLLELVSYALLFIFSSLLVRVILNFNRKSRPRYPPSPIALPIIGHLHLLNPFIHQAFSQISSRYGPLIYLRLGSVPCVVASTPELARDLLKTNELTFSARKHTAAIDHVTYSSSFAFAPYGPYWKFIKKFSTVELLGQRTLNQFLPIRTQELHYFVRALVEKSKTGEKVNLTQELLKLTSNIISQMMLSMRCSGTGTEADGVRTLVREVTEIFGEFNVSDILWFCKNLDLQGCRKRFEDVRVRYDALLEKIITNREEARKIKKAKGVMVDGEEEDKDFLDMMLDVAEEESAEMKLTRNHIKALIIDFLTAATDTTAIVTEWAVAELIRNPEVMKKAQKEIDDVVGKSRMVEEADSPKLTYLQAIIKESFRLHPPIPMISRMSVEECEVKGYTIPSKALVFVNIWQMGRDPNVWEDPMEFRPERFLTDANIDVRGLHYQLLPFGSGRRGCPGINLALQELPTTLGAIIQCFDWKVNGGVVDMSERPGLTAPRAHDLECFPTARFTPLDLAQL